MTNEKFKQADTLVGWVNDSVAPIINRAKFFDLADLEFYKSAGIGDGLEKLGNGYEFYDISQKDGRSVKEIIKDKHEDEYVSYVIKVDLNDLKENWREV